MSTSGSSDWTLTARDVVTYALRKLRVVSVAETPAAEDMVVGLQSLNAMLKGWQMTGPHLWRETLGSLALTTASSFSVPTPYRIISARFRQSGRDLPMEVLTREEYLEIPLKTSTGIPTQYYFDVQRDGGTLYIWPVMASVSGETVEYSYQRRFEDVDDPDDDLDIPQEWLETVGYALAARLADDYGKDAGKIEARAAQFLALAQASSREPVYRFEVQRR